MADSFVSKLITELTAKTTASDTDLVPIADSSGNFFKMTFAKLKELITSELNTKLTAGFAGGASSGTTNINIDSSNSNYLIIVCDNIDFSICVASRYAGTIKFCLLKNYSDVTYAQLDGRLIGITCNNSYIYSVTKLCHMIN